mmetsp:Transcript_4730/g.16634  ORF Transcript_4730/g.16634 Transcript_4730/m.16634 type:complete len:273 (+) Transcript_4730:36-854(+)
MEVLQYSKESGTNANNERKGGPRGQEVCGIRVAVIPGAVGRNVVGRGFARINGAAEAVVVRRLERAGDAHHRVGERRQRRRRRAVRGNGWGIVGVKHLAAVAGDVAEDVKDLLADRGVQNLGVVCHCSVDLALHSVAKHVDCVCEVLAELRRRIARVKSNIGDSYDGPGARVVDVQCGIEWNLLSVHVVHGGSESGSNGRLRNGNLDACLVDEAGEEFEVELVRHVGKGAHSCAETDDTNGSNKLVVGCGRKRARVKLGRPFVNNPESVGPV